MSMDGGIWKSVVEPVALTLKSVEVAPLLVDEPIAKSVVSTEVDAAFTERSANGDVEPMPILPLPLPTVSAEIPVPELVLKKRLPP